MAKKATKKKKKTTKRRKPGGSVRYSASTKDACLKELRAGQMTARAISEKFKVGYQTIMAWKKQLGGGAVGRGRAAATGDLKARHRAARKNYDRALGELLAAERALAQADMNEKLRKLLG